VIVVDRPALGRHFAHSIAAVREQVPESLRTIAARQPAADSNDRYGIRTLLLELFELRLELDRQQGQTFWRELLDPLQKLVHRIRSIFWASSRSTSSSERSSIRSSVVPAGAAATEAGLP